MSWYRASTISLTNGSTAVTGAATDFIANCAVGEGLLAPDGKVYEIAAIVSATALTLGSAYLGSTASGQSYSIVPTQSYLRDLALQAATLVNDYQSVLDSAGAGKFGDGTLGSPGIQFSSDSNSGIRRTGTDALAVVTGGVDRITVDAAGAVAVVASLSVAGSAVPTIASTSTLTNKTLALGSNTISGTLAQFNTALSDGDFATLAGTETLTNKTLTSPAINGGVIDTTSTTATAAVGTSSTRLANTAFVQQEKEYLPALSQSLHIGAVVKAIVYDTSKDSDGGAWRKRCADKSWYTETLGGDRWIGQHATIAAAWTAAGSTTGAVYQASATAGAQTSGLFYTPTSSTTVTQVYRGVTREFPAVAGIVAESARVVIYDLSNGAMWMVFASTGTYSFAGYQPISRALSSVAAFNGSMVTGGAASGAMTVCNFVADTGLVYLATGSGLYAINERVYSRNATLTSRLVSVSTAIVNATVNDVAITVLDTAPIDPATGLPVPTIAVATAGGVSVIKDDGTVVNSSVAVAINSVTFRKGSTTVLATRDTAATAVMYSIASPYSSHTQYDPATAPFAYAAISGAKLLGATAMPSAVAAGFVSGLLVFKENPATPTKGMVAYVTTAYNTGWLPGDIRGAHLADTTAETVTASGELVTNGTFTTDTNWTKDTNWTIGSGTANAAAAAPGTAVYQALTPVLGEVYAITFTVSGYTSGSVYATLFDGTNGTVVSANGTYTHYITKTSGSTNFVGVASATTFTGSIDNISVKLAEPDRSVKNKGLVINGSLTKTAVASGAGLVAYSGFSGSNYLEQPYNSDLDFGTGDFCVMGWVLATDTTAVRPILDRCDTGGAGARIHLYTNITTGYISFLVAGVNRVSTTNVCNGAYNCIAFVRRSGVGELWVNGVMVDSVACAGTTTNTTAVYRQGQNYALSGGTSLMAHALWRISATAPSADQIAHIYRTELPLFQASAQCTIAGSSTAVTALAYDDTTELLHVGTSWGRTGFKDLLRVDSEATTTGALTSLSASQGVIITGGTSGKVYVPAMLLRDELRRKDEARKALGKVPVFFDHTATASQTAFVAPKGYTIKAVYHNGTLKRETTTGVYWTRSSDGFAETCTLSAGATVSDWISLMCVRT